MRCLRHFCRFGLILHGSRGILSAATSASRLSAQAKPAVENKDVAECPPITVDVSTTPDHEKTSDAEGHADESHHLQTLDDTAVDRQTGIFQRTDIFLAEEPPDEVGFWQSEKGLEIKEQGMTALGRVLRLFVSKERYDNLYETALKWEMYMVDRYNKGDDFTLQKQGPEWAFGQLIFSIGGAIKLVDDDRWVDDPHCLRTRKRTDFKLEAVDLRKTAIAKKGLKYISDIKYLRYLNVGDAKHFDDHSMTSLHPVCDTLEFLDVSGTSITERGLSYLRLFPKLRYLNLSRLERAKDLDQLVPLLEEILPEHCCIVMDDNSPADSYGQEIPFRHPKHPSRDVPAPKHDENIGNLLMFCEESGTQLDLHHPHAVHALWKTPVIGSRRRSLLEGPQRNIADNFYFKLVKYIVKAEKYPPLV